MSMLKAWLINFPESIDLARYYSILNDAEIQKAERFKFKINKAHAVLSRYYTRHLLSELLLAPAEEINICYTEYGKPFIDVGNYHFNVSHSGEYILIAISDLTFVGVDIEKINRKIDIHDIAGRFFTKNEYSMLKQVDTSMQHDAFYRLWTRKESFIKAHGEGLSISLHDFEVDMDKEIASLRELSLRNENNEDWTVFNVETPEDYRAAITLKNREFIDLEIVKIGLN